MGAAVVRSLEELTREVSAPGQHHPGPDEGPALLMPPDKSVSLLPFPLNLSPLPSPGGEGIQASERALPKGRGQ